MIELLELHELHKPNSSQQGEFLSFCILPLEDGKGGVLNNFICPLLHFPPALAQALLWYLTFAFFLAGGIQCLPPTVLWWQVCPSHPAFIPDMEGPARGNSMSLYQGTEPWGTVKLLPNHSQLMLPWKSSVHIENSRVLCGETSRVSSAGLGYHSSFVGTLEFGLQQFIKNRSCRQDLSWAVSYHLLAAVLPLSFPLCFISHTQVLFQILAWACHTFLPETSTIVLCKQCPIFIIIFIHTQAALGVVSPRKASDHPGRNSQAPQNCAKERAVNHLCILLSADRCRASSGARSAVWTLQEALLPQEIRCHRCI